MSGSSHQTIFSGSDIEGLAPAMKIGLLATVNDEGLPHMKIGRAHV